MKRKSLNRPTYIVVIFHSQCASAAAASHIKKAIYIALLLIQMGRVSRTPALDLPEREEKRKQTKKKERKKGCMGGKTYPHSKKKEKRASATFRTLNATYGIIMVSVGARKRADPASA